MLKSSKAIAAELTNLVSDMGFQYNTVSNEILNDHRTLQQNFMRLCISYIKAVAETPDGRFDLRNEASVKFAKAVVNNLPEKLMFLPYV